MQAVVDGEIARDDAARISQMQLRFTNGEIEQKIMATSELKQVSICPLHRRQWPPHNFRGVVRQFLEDSLSLVETEERLLAAEIIELDRMERSHLVRRVAALCAPSSSE